ncbi:ATP-grasp domain-containing protein [Phytohabitans kaempferiae]|uniref:RimK family alpha-L-glutamate ligase n=1 Tax=Phytohabitans kaempferiae TaxID=1620943 RepID=A0ABV6M5P7_9ACTN
MSRDAGGHEPDVPLLWQLDDERRTFRLGAGEPHATAHAPPPASAAGGPTGTVTGVVFLARADDVEVNAVRRALRGYAVPTVRVSPESARPGLSATAKGLRFHAGSSAVRPTVVWVRHYSARARRHPSIALDRFSDDSWRALLAGLDRLTDAPVIGAGPGLIQQLDAARRANVRVPRTVVTSRPAADLHALPGDSLVVKAVDRHFVESAPGRLSGIFAQVVPRDAALHWADSVPVPLILQEYVASDAELRVYYTKGAQTAYRVVKDAPASPWLDRCRVQVTACPVPPRVGRTVALLARRMGLSYAAFDLLMVGDEPVFLEANADGDWRWYERLAGDDAVTAAAARMVAGLHHRSLGPLRAAGPSLLAILGA